MYPRNGTELCKWEETERAQEKHTHTQTVKKIKPT